DLVLAVHVDHDLLLVDVRRFKLRDIDVQHALVVDRDRLEERDLEIEPRLPDFALQLAELQNQRLLGLPDREHRGKYGDKNDNQRRDDAADEMRAVHCVPPWSIAVGAGGEVEGPSSLRRMSWSSGRWGTVPPEPAGSSTNTLSMLRRSRSSGTRQRRRAVRSGLGVG